MKKLLLILILASCILVSSCSKREMPTEAVQPKYELAVCELAPPTDNAKGKDNAPGQNRPPKPPKPTPTPDPDPTPDPTPDPPKPPYTDPEGTMAVLYANFNQFNNDNEDWMRSMGLTSPYFTPASKMTAEEKQEAIDTLKGQFAPFRVKVITDSVEFQMSPLPKTMIVISGARRPNSVNASGVAFPFSILGPKSVCYVYEDILNLWGSWVGKIAAHEAGHTFGCHHQKEYSSTGELLNGYINGATMGQCFYAPCKWIVGIWWWVAPEAPYIQDDKAVITAVAGYR